MRDLLDTILERAGRDPEYLRELLVEFSRVEMELQAEVKELRAKLKELKLDNDWLVNYYKHKIDSERHEALDELAAQAQELGMGYNQGGTPRHPERPPTWHPDH